MNNKPKALEDFMSALMKDACNKTDFSDFLEWYSIEYSDFEEIEKWFKDELGIII